METRAQHGLDGSTYNSTCEQIDDVESDPENEDPDDPERLLNEWLGELNSLTGGLDSVSPCSMRPLNSHLNTPRIDSYRFSMANLEDSQDTELDAILGELCALETQCEQALTRHKAPAPGENATSRSYSQSQQQPRPTHSRSSSEGNRAKVDPDDHLGKPDVLARTESPDNDSAFSDNVSMLSSESSASSGGSGGGRGGQPQPQQLGSPTAAVVQQMDTASRAKAEKIRIALEKMREASVKKLFIKAFGCDGSSKSLLVDEAMTAGHVARMLADKNHVAMEPRLAVVEHLPDLHMERAYEDHEPLVENLLMWTRDSRNKLLFLERPEKVALFQVPEAFLLPPTQRGVQEYDDHARSMLIEEFFSGGAVVPEVEGPLYLKSESKKGWKRHHFVLRASGLYYLPKDKTRGAASARDLTHLASFDVNQVYYGVGWRKKYKAPTDFCFAIKHPRLQQPKSSKFVKFLCAEDEASLHRWVTGIRLAKFGRRLLEDYRSLVDELAQEDLEQLAAARSWSVGCIAQPAPAATSPCDAASTSSSSSSGCLSDTGCCDGSAGGSTLSGNAAGFECDFPTTGTIKRKPSVNPKLPLTSITRQLKEVGEGAARTPSPQTTPTEVDGTATLVHRAGSVRRRRPSCQTPSTPDSGSGSNSSTLKRQHGTRPASSASSGASTPVREPQPPPPAEIEVFSPTTRTLQPEEELPPPPDDMLRSTLSLDSLPPPPPPQVNDAQLSGSQLSLVSLPPPPPPYRPPPPPPTPPSGTSTPTGCLSPVPPPTPPPIYSAPPYLAELKAASSPSPVRRAPHSPSTQQRSRTTGKKISFAIPDDVAVDGTRSLPPPPPRRSESTRLSTPRPAPQHLPPPPKDFLKDLQRVMKKKWQVAQKCKADLTTTPHEVLGFRDAPPPPPPLPPGGREDSVRDWVREHYGGPYSLYENVHLVNGRQQQAPVVVAPSAPRLSRQNSVAAAIAAKKRPPPPPPKRAETTQLSTVPPPVHRR